jgi:hypothetical protein
MTQGVDVLSRRPFVTAEVHARAQRDLRHPLASVGGLAQDTDGAIVIFVGNNRRRMDRQTVLSRRAARRTQQRARRRRIAIHARGHTGRRRSGRLPVASIE